jgi:hypothetical protein
MKKQHNYSPIKAVKKVNYEWIQAPNEFSTLDQHGFKVTKKVKEGCANIFYDPNRMRVSSPTRSRAALFQDGTIEVD